MTSIDTFICDNCHTREYADRIKEITKKDRWMFVKRVEVSRIGAFSGRGFELSLYDKHFCSTSCFFSYSLSILEIPQCDSKVMEDIRLKTPTVEVDS